MDQFGHPATVGRGRRRWRSTTAAAAAATAGLPIRRRLPCHRRPTAAVVVVIDLICATGREASLEGRWRWPPPGRRPAAPPAGRERRRAGSNVAEALGGRPRAAPPPRRASPVLAGGATRRGRHDARVDGAVRGGGDAGNGDRRRQPNCGERDGVGRAGGAPPQVRWRCVVGAGGGGRANGWEWARARRRLPKN